jgi:N-acetylglucosamine kinase-like BadF-type ATPase
MILIADSGSTKTIWKCTDGAGKVKTANTAGINPYYNNRNDIIKETTHARSQLSALNIEEIYFYGAGCSTDRQKEIVSQALASQFGSEKISVNTDLLGAARALFQKESGIVCILGTGSGSCIYNGDQIIKSIPSLGFILGDEGSGASLGKQFVRDFLREDMPSDLIRIINEELGINKEEVLLHVNQDAMPSKYLAGFSKYLHEYLDNTYIHDLVYHSFEEFVKEYVVRYDGCQGYKTGFIGSIAVNYQKILKEVLDKYQLELGKIETNPIDGLIEYHLSQKQ